MRAMRQAVFALAFASILVPGRARADGTVLSLDDAIARAVAGPRGRMARADTDAARARVGEADAARLPRGKATGFLTLSPEIRCENPECTATDPDEFALRFSGAFGGISIEAVQPLFTFGKIGAARAAAREGVAAQHALEDETAGDVAVDVARAYWGIKLAREIYFMLDDGAEQIDKALVTLDEQIADKSGDITLQDKLRVETLKAEVLVRRAEARQGELVALAGLRVLTGVADADVDDAELVAVERELPGADAVVKAATARPQAIAAAAGARAADRLAALESAYHLPDLALVGTFTFAGAQGVEEPQSAFMYDPFNTLSGGLAVVLRWQLDPFTTSAKASRARAQAKRAEAQAALARDGATFDARTAQAEAAAAKDRVDAATAGEASSKAWLASVLQGQAVGTVEAKDLADAYIAWFQMRARLFEAVFQWNVAVVRLGRATGEFHAEPSRRKVSK
jgi:outer membrane protein TolC